MVKRDSDVLEGLVRLVHGDKVVWVALNSIEKGPEKGPKSQFDRSVCMSSLYYRRISVSNFIKGTEQIDCY